MIKDLIGLCKHKNWALVLILMGTLVVESVFAQSDRLIVEVMNINESKGVVYVALYNSEKDYVEKATYSLSAMAVKGNLQLVFTDLPSGEYAISAIHDANENKELDKNFFGIPKEGFGFLNGKMGTFGPPSFDNVKIIWNGEKKKVEVPLRYY